MPEEGDALLSGGWCLTREIRDLIEERRLTYQLADYPWDDREKYFQDYLYLMSVYESFLATLSQSLNALHDENHSIDFWRLVAGPALYTILCHLLDRWRIAENMLQSETFDAITLLEFPVYAFTPGITTDLNPDSHDYNHYLISSALRELGLGHDKILRTIRQTGAAVAVQPASAHRAPARRAIQAIRSSIDAAMRFCHAGESNQVFIIDSCMPKRHEALLNISLGNFPLTRRSNRLELPAPDPGVREAMDLTAAGNDRFSLYAARMLREMLPVYLAEGYSQLEKCWQSNCWPRRPKVIFTSNAFQFNEVFQHYAATQIASSGARLVVGQHGGVSGILKWSYGDEHFVRIADRFLSWGYGAEINSIVPAFVLTILGKRLRSAKAGCLLLTTVPVRLYSHKGGAWPVGPNQSAKFLAQQLNFFRNLDESVSGDVLLRIFEHLDIRFESGYLEKWRINFPGIRVDNSRTSIFKALEKTKLFVYTYNSTGYLETLAMNFPTVMFWDPDLFEGKPAFNEILNELEEAGIYHRTPESAAIHINRIWNDLDQWWHSPRVQQCRIRFERRFARPPPENWLGFLKKNLAAQAPVTHLNS